MTEREEIEDLKRRLASAERRAAELQAVVEGVGDAIYIGGAEGISMSNQPALEQLGFESQEELYRNIGTLAAEIQTRDAQTNEPISSEEQPFMQALSGKKCVREVRVRHRLTGEDRILRSSAAPVIVDGRVVAAVAINTDITEPKRAEVALRQSEERQAFLLKLSDALRPLGNPSEIKATATRLLGELLAVSRVVYADAVAGCWVVTKGYERDVAPLPDAPLAMAACGDWILDHFRAGRRLVADDINSDARFSASERATYERLQIGAEAALPLVKDGALIAVVAVQESKPRHWTPHELTLLEEVAERTWVSVERARAEAVVRESEEKYRTLFNSMEEGFCVLEVVFDASQQPTDLRFVEVNPAFERNTGLSDAKGRCVREVVPGLEAQWFEIYGAVAMTGERRRFESEAKALGRWFEVNTFRIDPPEQHRVAVLFRDITERRAREQELKRMNRDLEQFAYSASHDLQEPIRTVSMYAELLAGSSANLFSPEMAEWLQFIQAGAHRMERLVRDLLSYLQVSRQDATPTEVDANECLQAALSNLEGAIRESGAQIAAAALPRLVIQRVHLEQLFQNLIGNAIKYRAAERTPTIKIEAAREQRGWRISIADNGIGIESDYRQSIFGLFKRLHSEQRYPGTGIGLAICQRVVERSGGRIWVESEFGRGSTFHFWLPELGARGVGN